MTNHPIPQPIDILQIEYEARKLRAAFLRGLFASGWQALVRGVSSQGQRTVRP